MRLARLLTMLHEIDLNAWNDAKKLVIETLDAAKNRLQTEDPDFDAKLSSHGEITIQAVAVEQGTWKESEGQPVSVRLDQKNIDELFERYPKQTNGQRPFQSTRS